MNIVVLRGMLPHEPERRELTAGGDLLIFDLVTVLDGGMTAAVPINWLDAPDDAGVHEGTEVVVIGSVRRRFFRAGGYTQSRVEILAESVTVATQARTVAKRLSAAIERIQ